MLEKMLALHCGPALAGIKPSNMMSFSTDDVSGVKKQLEALNQRLNGSDIFLRVLCEYKNRVLILVYREKKLMAYLNRPEIAAFLAKYNYPADISIEKYLKMLSERIAKNNEFPHEVGAFLGYPIGDIYGFIYNKSACQFTGYWRVYKNADEARELFRKYDVCKNAILNCLNSGRTLTEMFGV